jgi:hypothetical protein
MEGCLELSYKDHLREGMSIDINGKPGKTCVFDHDKIKACPSITSEVIEKEIVKK